MIWQYKVTRLVILTKSKLWYISPLRSCVLKFVYKCTIPRLWRVMRITHTFSIIIDTKKVTFSTYLGQLPLKVTHRKSQKCHCFTCLPLPCNNAHNIVTPKTASKPVILTQKIHPKRPKTAKMTFSKSHHNSTGSHSTAIIFCPCHILDTRTSNLLLGGTSGQTGNSWFFDFWGEYLKTFGGKSIFCKSQKVVYYQNPTKLLIRVDLETWLYHTQTTIP